jgi:hypothetical protein
MALLHRRNPDDRHVTDPAYTDQRYADPAYVDERGRQRSDRTSLDDRTTLSAHDGWNSTVRAVAAVVAGLAMVLGVVALFRVDWDAGLDAAAVDVMGVGFTPMVAIVTVVASAIALVAAASPDRTSKIVVGAVLACAGIGILLASTANQADLHVEDAHGWIALVVGAVLLLAGITLRSSWTSHRHVRSGGYAH